MRAYRAHVDEALTQLFTRGFVDEGPDPLAVLIELGINHEQQHQELLLTDILSLFAANLLRPAYRDPVPKLEPVEPAAAAEYIAFEGGIRAIGYDGAGFSYDNEGPRHEVLLYPYPAGRSLRDQRRMARLHGGRRLPRAARVAGRRLGDGEGARAGKRPATGRSATASGIR